MGSTAYAINPEYGVLCDGSETVVEYQTFGSPERAEVSFASNRGFEKVSMRAGLRPTEEILAQINHKIDQLNRKFEGIKKDIVTEIRSSDRIDEVSENCPSAILKSEYGFGMAASRNSGISSIHSPALSRFAPGDIHRTRQVQSRFEASKVSSALPKNNVPASPFLGASHMR